MDVSDVSLQLIPAFLGVLLCKVLECRYIRVFSFYPPKGEDPNTCGEQVLEKLKVLIQIAEKNNVILIHENEKGIFGDTGDRCKYVMDTLGGPHFRHSSTLQSWQRFSSWATWVSKAS
mgnify:CR=1 FL=1